MGKTPIHLCPCIRDRSPVYKPFSSYRSNLAVSCHVLWAAGSNRGIGVEDIFCGRLLEFQEDTLQTHSHQKFLERLGFVPDNVNRNSRRKRPHMIFLRQSFKKLSRGRRMYLLYIFTRSTFDFIPHSIMRFIPTETPRRRRKILHNNRRVTSEVQGDAPFLIRRYQPLTPLMNLYQLPRAFGRISFRYLNPVDG